ncbi:hypothetical protein FA95DRAFT_1517317 [Auriscalpium vulgare]|uniref:Uncharacterized protein n=1 Tax=Auriscalpium vulgare TaxID=40419 RepID=A0ACB8RXR4_9AGAM|nr:hypothetical protein FA95DRAFT_1517317 [Auriscalpium vulgare]
MHRFRKWSDPRRSQVPDSARSSASSSSRTPLYPVEPVPALPPASDFRTSLILPDLSRRFTLLRDASGDPVSIDGLKSKFAEQRARGAQNSLSEEEEDMLLETLGRLRAKASMSSSTASRTDSAYGAGRDSASDTGGSSVTSSPRGSASSKRYSNNMFGSGRLRDYNYTYMRNAQQQSRGGSGVSTLSTLSSSSARATATEDNPHENGAAHAQVLEDHDNGVSEDATATLLEKRLSKTFRREHLRRASMALEDVIREIEEEAEVVPDDGDGDDKILVPRSPVVHHERSASVANGTVHRSPDDYETGTAVSPDPADVDRSRSTPSPYPRSAGASPTPRIPGYVPGMPRPMTPRDFSFDTDDASPSNSTTPRATSPRLPGNGRASPVVPLHIASSILRRESNQPRPSSPLSTAAPYTPRSPNGSGRYTPEDITRGPDDSFMDFGNPLDSSILGRRRPASPLGANTFQPMSVSSRPGTPSNVTWKKPAHSHKGSGSSASGHSRSGSSVSFTEAPSERPGSRARSGSVGTGLGHTRNESAASTNDLHDVLHFDRAMSSMSRAMRSPALPDSPTDTNIAGAQSLSALMSAGQAAAENRPPSALSGSDPLSASSSFVSRPLRSPTPTQFAQRSPASPSFPDNDLTINTRSAKRASKQTISSPFSLNQSNPLILSPMLNSSRSSMESVGSSYHSWEAENKTDRTVQLLAAFEPQQPAWHDLAGTEHSSASTFGDGAIDAEDIIQQYAGLSKVDFVAIQERLVFAAKLKADAPETRERHNSLRRRRPSTSQSVHSTNGRESRNAEPAPQVSSRAMPPENVAKANALLDSVLDSIQSPSTRSVDVNATNIMDDVTQKPAQSPTDTELSSPTRRRRAALADALFGELDSGEVPVSPNVVAGHPRPRPSVPLAPESLKSHPSHEAASPSPLPSSSLPVSPPSASAPPDSPFANQVELAKEVQRRTDVAMAQLKKIPSNSKINEGGSVAQRRHVDRSQISAPKLVSASTSVDTIPLRSPSAASGVAPGQNPSKLGSRFKRLRGTLRAKPNALSGDEVTPYPLDLNSPSSSQTVRYEPMPSPPEKPAVTSASDLGRSKTSPTMVVTPPASAGPGLKGFMARFLKRPSETSELDRRRTAQYSTTLAPPAPYGSQFQQASAQQVRSAPPENLSFRVPPPKNPGPPASTMSPPPSAPPQTAHASFDSGQSKAADENALRQLFDAANNLGLDQSALSDLLARSTSVSSRSTAALTSKHASAATTGWAGENTVYERALSPTASKGRPSFDQSPASRQSPDVVKKLSVRKPTARAPLPSEGNTVVRRTLIFPSEARQATPDISVPSRKGSTRRRRSASAASVNSGSLHDRAPTPPPPRSPTGKRFSTDSSPPLPQIPVSLLSQTENIANMPLSAPPLPLEKSSSAYDSLYEMYTGDGKPAISVSEAQPGPGDAGQGPSADTLANLEPGAAVEVLEMANGETIWSIVNGLRDDDAESFYGSRASFMSEYSLRDEGVQLFFKEHGRKTSKDSQSSFLSRRRTTQGVPKRPETKVFFSSAAQIGRLIDNLSHGADAGSFNIAPTAPHANSFHSESSAHWTVEERLERMLGSLTTS